MNIEDLKGKTLVKIDVNDDYEIIFETDEGKRYMMYHEQDCCEDVTIEDICGDIKDLLNNPLLEAEEASNGKEGPVRDDESYTWTFYKFATIKGSVVIRWYGNSSGYYSESVDFKEV